MSEQTALFSTNRSLKNAGTIHFMFGGRFGVSQTGTEAQNFGGFFHQIKVHQKIIGRVSIQPIFRESRRIGGIFLTQLIKT